jgi:hypothetical protein
MGLRSDIQTDIAAAFDTDLADAVRVFTLQHVVAESYSAETGQPTYTTVKVSSRGVFEEITNDEIDSSARPTSTTLTVLQNELDAVPLIDDTIIEGNFIYDITAVAPDPAAATWALTLIARNDGPRT